MNKNPYKEHLEHVKGNVVNIRIPDVGLYETLPHTIELYKQMIDELGSPEAVHEVIMELVAIARLGGADITEEKILAVQSEMLNIYMAHRKPRPLEKVG